MQLQPNRVCQPSQASRRESSEITCCTPAFLRDHDEARDGVSMYLGQSQQIIVDGSNSRGVLIESRFVFDACFTRTLKTGPKNTALTA